MTNLFEDLALVQGLLASEVPAEVLLHERLRLVSVGVELEPRVALVVDGPVVGQREGELLASPHPHSRDGRVVVGSEEADGREAVLLQSLQSLQSQLLRNFLRKSIDNRSFLTFFNLHHETGTESKDRK